VIASALATRLPGLVERAGRKEKTGNTEAVVVVPVVGFVPVAVRRAQVPWIVVPGAAAKHASLRATQASIQAPIASNPCRRSSADVAVYLGCKAITTPRQLAAEVQSIHCSFD
jgi:hypothetical protein